jgi:type I restriction enzyme S subunit
MSDVPEGYRMSEVGVIPVDWDVKTLGEKATKIGSGITPTGGEKVYKSEGRPFLRSQNVGWGNLILEDIAFIDDKIHNTFKATEIEKNDVFLNITGASIGRSAIADERVQNGNVNQHVCIIRTIDDELNPKFLNYFLLSKKGQKQIDSFQAGGNRQGLNFGQIKSFQIPIPSLHEQKAIASALSDVDALITALEQLITKKRNIKQGAMQQLLTGKKRLPGFGGVWEVKNFSDVCWFQEGPGLRNWQFTKEGMKVINVTNLENGYLNLDRTDRHISIDEFNKMYQHFEIDDRDIVVASSGNSYAKTAVVRKRDLPLMMNTSVIRFKPLKTLEYNFLLSFLKSDLFKDQIDLLITGGAQPNFGPAHLKEIKITIPEYFEQQAIAKILSDMDTEIESLEQKRNKYKAIKQGMMQELLTGKMRLLKEDKT